MRPASRVGPVLVLAPPFPTLTRVTTSAPHPAPTGSPLVPLRVLLWLAADLLSTPFHVVVFLASRGATRARFADTLREHRP